MRRSAMAGLGLAGLAAVAAHAHAQTADPPTMPEAAATAILGFMPDEGRDWGMDWSTFGTRARAVRWHLAPPDRIEADASGDVWRTGWVQAVGSQADLIACGSRERVEAIAILIRDLYGHHARDMYGDTGSDAVIEALRAQGADVRLLNESRLPDHFGGEPGPSNWRISVAGKQDAEINAYQACTPEGSAAARRCRTTYRVEFDPDRPDRADSFGARCERR